MRKLLSRESVLKEQDQSYILVQNIPPTKSHHDMSQLANLSLFLVQSFFFLKSHHPLFFPYYFFRTLISFWNLFPNMNSISVIINC